MRRKAEARPIILELPGKAPVTLTHLVLDFTGALSLDGRMLPGVARRLKKLAKRVRITVMTADTFGTAGEAIEGLPVIVWIVDAGEKKATYVAKLGAENVGAVGNGRNDVAMLTVAALGIAVIGPEGAAGDLVRVAKVVVRDISDALDLLLHPIRQKATLRD